MPTSQNNYLFNLPEEIQDKIFIISDAANHKEAMRETFEFIEVINFAYCNLLTHNPLTHNWKRSFFRRKNRDGCYTLYLGDGHAKNVKCGSYNGSLLSYTKPSTAFGLMGVYHWINPDDVNGLKLYREVTKDYIKEFLKENNIKYKSRHTRKQLITLMMSF